MDFITYMQKLEFLQHCIENKSCVTNAALSQKLEVSERTVYRMIENLKLKGVNIQHCKRSRVYLLKNKCACQFLADARIIFEPCYQEIKP
jgi:biotin operon repressor